MPMPIDTDMAPPAKAAAIEIAPVKASIEDESPAATCTLPATTPFASLSPWMEACTAVEIRFSDTRPAPM